MVSQGSRVPVSQLLHAAAAAAASSSATVNKAGTTTTTTDAIDEPVKKSREDWRRAKELEEARKAGTAPAAVDEDGRDINPHIPQYISNAPWYYGCTGPTLRHQRPQVTANDAPSSSSTAAAVAASIDDWYRRGVDKTHLHTRYRAGACENCGAITHKRVDCLERPRKVGAKYSGALLAYDDHVQPVLRPDFDGKRDRWAGYDAAAHKDIIDEYQKVELAKQRIKADKLKRPPETEAAAAAAAAADADEVDEADEDKYVDEVDMPGTKVDSKQRITVRNLRIREDTAKYLRNLDPNSAYYDPKTRSMRDNPNQRAAHEASESSAGEFAGENCVRFSGDTSKHALAQMFAWEAHGRGVDVHLLAEPTKLELLQHEYERKKAEFKACGKSAIVNAYGGAEHLEAMPPRALLLAQSEEYVEYSRGGRVIRGQARQPQRSRYEEDVLPNNHRSVWGSWWSNGAWGYRCCRSLMRASYCVPIDGVGGDDDDDVHGHTFIPDCVHTAVQQQQLAQSQAKQKRHQQTADEAAVARQGHDIQSDEVVHGQPKESDDVVDNQNCCGRSEKTTRKKPKKKKKRKSRSKKSKQVVTKVASSSTSSSASEDGADNGKTVGLAKALMAEEKRVAGVAKILRYDERKRPYTSMETVMEPSSNDIEAFLIRRRRDDDPMV